MSQMTVSANASKLLWRTRPGALCAALVVLELAAGLFVVRADISVSIGQTGRSVPLSVILVAAAAALSLAPQISPNALYALGIAALPVVFVEPAPTDALLTAAFIAFLLKEGVKRPSGTWLVGVGLLGGTTLLTSAVHPPTPYGVRFAAVTFFMFVIAVTVWTAVDSQDDMRRTVRLVVWSSLAALVIAMPIYLLHLGGPGLFDLVSRHGAERLKGFFKDPNVFGPYYLFAGFLAAYLVSVETGRRRTVAWCAVVMSGLAVVLSVSRAAIGAGGLAVVLYLLLRRPRRFGVIAAVGLTAVVGYLVLHYLAASQPALREVLTSRTHDHLQSYDANRFGRQSQGWHAGIEHPEGLGPGWFNTTGIPAHSLYIRTWAENGALGFVGLLTFIVAVTRSAVRYWRRDPNGLGLSLLVTWLATLLISGVVDTLHWRHLWLAATLIVVGDRLTSNRTSLAYV